MPTLPVRLTDERAYCQIFNHELLLRRVLRWELRGCFGRLWYQRIGRHGVSIEERIRSEKEHGWYDPQVSELAYLGLREIIDIVCGLQWNAIFSKMFRHRLPKHLLKNGLRKVVGMRNKVAHFRPVMSTESEEAIIGQLLSAFGGYYGARLEAAVYLSGDPSKSEDQFRTDELKLVQKALANCRLNAVWDEYTKLEGIRAVGLSPGLGIVDHHFFYEIYGQGSFNSEPIVSWADRAKYHVTFVTVGRYGHYIRAFIPLENDAKRSQKR